jgi:hypothetical protein
MRSKTILVCAVLAMLAPAGFSQASSAGTGTDKLPIEGVWRAQADGLPYVAMIVTNESGSLCGAVQFYFHRRDAVGQPWTSTPGLPEPLFNPKFDGKTLTFQVSHRRAHPPRTLNDPPVNFHMKLIGPDKAELVNESEGGSGSQGVLTRSEY